MVLSAYAATGPLIATACGTPNPAAIAAWTSVCAVLATWLPANCAVKPGLMVATTPGVVAGLGVITIAATAAVLGPLLALAAGSLPSDAAATAKWILIAGHIITDFTTNIKIQGSTYIAVPTTGGPITGVASLQLVSPLLSGLFATLATDAPGIAIWTAIGTIMETQFITLGASAALSLGLLSPSGGGPLTGQSTIL